MVSAKKGSRLVVSLDALLVCVFFFLGCVFFGALFAKAGAPAIAGSSAGSSAST
jgi:hypothetical protein